ncbi:hypothetical protein [Fluviicola sp.]|uniref:hypothetical protein n=1 Tax=Fluviicola sp. TaxID=1917219 RepID=UPI0031D05066
MKYLIWSLITLALILGLCLLLGGMHDLDFHNPSGTAEIISGSVLFAGGLIALVLHAKNQNRY